MALRRCPICAALLGLMLECSTRILPGGSSTLRLLIGSQSSGCDGGAVDAGVDVSRAGKLELFKTFDRTNAGDDFFGNFARRLAELLGEFEGEGERVFSHLDLGRLLDDDAGQVEIVGAAQEIAHLLGKTAFEMTIQRGPLNC